MEIGVLTISICFTDLFCGTSSGSRLHGRSAAGFSCQLLNCINYRLDKSKRRIPLVPCNANWSRMKHGEMAGRQKNNRERLFHLPTIKHCITICQSPEVISKQICKYKDIHIYSHAWLLPHASHPSQVKYNHTSPVRNQPATPRCQRWPSGSSAGSCRW
jgi:hypothetical protein